MRLSEWLFLLSFIPAILLPAISQTWRQRWLIVSSLLPILVGILHIVVEGWRIQMLPLYVYAVIVLVIRIPALRKRESVVRRWRGLLVSIGSASIIVGGGVGAGWLMPVITLPEITGPYAVGIVDRELVDAERGRQLMVSIWYPAAHSGPPAPLTHYPNEIATALGNVSGLPGLALQHLRYFRVAASEGVPVLAASTPFPVLVFSHGMVGVRLQNSSTLQELASWGYIVISIDHTDAAAVTVFPDGKAHYYDLTRFGIPADLEPNAALMNEHVLPVWVADQRFVYDRLEEWQKNDPLLAGKLDLTQIASFGHSFGGATALEVCLVETRCRAAVDLDGGLYGSSVSLPAVRPVMLMSSAESNQYTDAVTLWSHMISTAANNSYWLELPNSSHLSFTISQLISPLLAPPGFDPPAGLRTIDKYLRLFFDIYLRGADPKQLQPTSENTDVRWLSK